MAGMRVVMTVVVETPEDGDYYFDRDDLIRHVKMWIEDGLYDRDDLTSVTVTEQMTRCRCGKDIEDRGTPNMGGTAHVNWVHVPGGYSICHPQQPHSPRAQPDGQQND